MQFPRTEEYIKHALSQGKGSNIASQHRGTSVRKGDFELPAAISSQNYEKKKKKNFGHSLCSFIRWKNEPGIQYTQSHAYTFLYHHEIIYWTFTDYFFLIVGTLIGSMSNKNWPRIMMLLN